MHCKGTGPGTTWANEINFVMNQAPGVGHVDQQSSALCYGCLLRHDRGAISSRTLAIGWINGIRHAELINADYATQGTSET